MLSGQGKVINTLEIMIARTNLNTEQENFFSYHWLLTQIRGFIPTQHGHITHLHGRRPGFVLRCWVWINSHIRVSKLRVTNLSHARTMFVTFWNVSASLKSKLSHWFGINHRINNVFLGRSAVTRKVYGGRNSHCDAINDVPFSLYLT